MTTRRACLFLLAATVAAGTAALAAERAAPDPVEGSRLFVSKGCVGCHAVDGEGGKVGPDLGRISSGRTLLGMAAVMWNHSPRMTERIKEAKVTRPKLTPEEMANLLAFLNYTGYLGTPGNSKRGAELFRDRSCVRCHSVGGAGGTMGPGLDRFKRFTSPIAIAAAMWNHGFAMEQEARSRGLPWPDLDGRDLADVVEFLRAGSRKK